MSRLKFYYIFENKCYFFCHWFHDVLVITDFKMINFLPGLGPSGATWFQGADGFGFLFLQTEDQTLRFEGRMSDEKSLENPVTNWGLFIK